VCALASWLYEGIKVLDLKIYYLRPYDILLRTCCAAHLYDTRPVKALKALLRLW
jgi:hypothetical protein